MKHVVGFSGGIDSQACARWVLNRFPANDVILLNSDAGGNEHPITESFVEEYSRSVHPVIRVQPIVADIKRPIPAERLTALGVTLASPLSFSLLAALKGYFPTGRMQFCTEALKLNPQKRWHEEHLYEEEVVRYSGLRRDESRRRAKRKEREWDDFFDCQLVNPIVRWKKQHCFDYVAWAKEPVNYLYSLGFDRVGCSPCVNSNKLDIRNWATRFPEMIAKVRDWEMQVGRPFFAAIVPGAITNWIDEVVEWSLTDRGGRQKNLLNVLPPPACSSKYGLCA